MTFRFSTRAICLAAFATYASGTALAAVPELKGKIKPGLYEYRVEMRGLPEMPGGANRTTKHCVTPQQADEGDIVRRDQASSCAMKDVHVNGNTASMRMDCQDGMKMKATVTFLPDGYTAESQIDAAPAEAGDNPIHIQQHVVAKYLGACKAGE